MAHIVMADSRAKSTVPAIDMCADMRVDICIDICTDVCVHVCIEGMRIDRPAAQDPG